MTTGQQQQPPESAALHSPQFTTYGEEMAELRKRISFSRVDHDHPATRCLRLLGLGTISIGKACEWLTAYFNTGEQQPIAEQPLDYPSDSDALGAFDVMYRENQELRQLFALQRTRQGEADKLWREATGKHDSLPDLGTLLAWLLEEIKIARAASRLTVGEMSELPAGHPVREILLALGNEMVMPRPAEAQRCSGCNGIGTTWVLGHDLCLKCAICDGKGYVLPEPNTELETKPAEEATQILADALTPVPIDVEKKVYLGDAVYAQLTYGMIRLTAEDRIAATNEIYLDGHVVRALLEFIEELNIPPGVKG